jgi:hypothetical protein
MAAKIETFEGLLLSRNDAVESIKQESFLTG